MNKESINNIFGDDGFRCKYGEKYLTKSFLITFSRSLGKYYKKKYKIPKCIIGIDTRQTGPKIYKIIARELINLNIGVNFCGVIPSPGVSHCLKKFNFHFGIMITASHNSFEDNGIKIFNSKGFKLNSKDEKSIEISIKRNLKKIKITKKNKILTLPLPVENKIYIKSYYKFLTNIIAGKLSDRKIIIDCSNGASSYLVSKLFKLEKNILIINNKPNGKNINLNCGSMYPNKLKKILIKKNYDFGLAFDGDSDRCILVDKKKGLIESEKVLFMLLKMLSNKKTKKTVCSSEIVNKALELNLNKIKYSLFQTKVGDRNVINYSKKKSAAIGFEPSGHFYFPEFNNSMDGNITMILILNYFINNYQNYKKIRKLENYKRIIENIPIANNNNLNTIKKKISNFKLLSSEKLLVRQSIWDPIYRIYYDYKNKNRFKEIKKFLLD